MTQDMLDLKKEYEVCELIKAPYPITDEIKRRREQWREKIYKNYELTEDEFIAIFKAQGLCCACCGTQDPAWSRNVYTPWCVDHDHDHKYISKNKRKAVRGILCESCNYGIGLLGDNLERLQSAVEYLSRYKAIKGADSMSNRRKHTPGISVGTTKSPVVLGADSVC